MAEQEMVAVIDDDEMVRLSLTMLIECLGVRVKSYPSGQEFLADPDHGGAGCVITDVRMPGFSGLELQARLAGREIPIPLIFITGHGDVPMAVRAMRGGAVDFLLKPFNDQILLDRVQQALEQGRAQRREADRRRQVQACFASLSQREQGVLQLVVAGKMNKVIAAELGISLKTVEAHRASIMAKMGAGSLAELVQKMALVLR